MKCLLIFLFSASTVLGDNYNFSMQFSTFDIPEMGNFGLSFYVGNFYEIHMPISISVNATLGNNETTFSLLSIDNQTLLSNYYYCLNGDVCNNIEKNQFCQSSNPSNHEFNLKNKATNYTLLMLDNSGYCTPTNGVLNDLILTIYFSVTTQYLYKDSLVEVLIVTSVLGVFFLFGNWWLWRQNKDIVEKNRYLYISLRE